MCALARDIYSPDRAEPMVFGRILGRRPAADFTASLAAFGGEDPGDADERWHYRKEPEQLAAAKSGTLSTETGLAAVRYPASWVGICSPCQQIGLGI